MCLLCVIEPNATPTREQLLNATSQNPDGFGYAFHCGDRIITGRGMDATEVVDRFLRIREGLPNTWAMFHARYTTHGATTKANCHPFRVGGDPSTVIGHNGIIPIKVPVGDTRSDTRVFADEWLPVLLGELDDKKTFEDIEEFIGGSKIAVFTHDERLKEQVYILNENLGHWDKGIWWSNYGYEPYVPSTTYKSLYGGRWWSDYDNDGMPIEAYDGELLGVGGADLGEAYCTKCLTILDALDLEEGLCNVCNYCLECGQFWTTCLCYNPERSINDRPALQPEAWDDDLAY